MFEEKRYKIGKKVSIIGLIVNILLSIIKIIVGITFSSMALIADGLHTVSDIASTIVILISIRFSQTPADRNHPYGHGKAEAIGTALLGLILLTTGFLLIKNTYSSIFDENIIQPGFIALWIAFFSIIIKEALYQYTVKMGRKINSKGLIADAHHHRSDAFSSIAALIGVTGSRLGFSYLDPLAGLIVAIFIAKIGFDILKDAVNELMDCIPDLSQVKEFKQIANAVNRVNNVGDIKLRSYGPSIFVEISIAVDNNLTVGEGHNVAKDVEKRLKDSDESIQDVLVHVDPW
ncbi:cation diffusion facilitator family transporter [Halanaerobium congolense]|uniref:Cation diffusion facilitator family transporter n=1 Tax=Halanaerobium kushneri TaxID=56779 RepID=A0A1N6PJH2_9FIRM|nr:cation diffusion facilitator family transporter [Halanaerobium congolense]SDN10486.1 cation diffusion facilitator family transporter [Halanaerobium congolense]SIQ04481.1 cation diffusion facilitator family transporter [Halanaerobium kushneri]